MSEDGTQGEARQIVLRDWSASSRLTLQHFIWKTRQGWILHPTIQASIPLSSSSTQPSSDPPLRIADVAAGNCIWAIDNLPSLPASAHITAFDNSTVMYPPPLTCPSNLTLETWDFFTPPPPQYLSYFDIVHVRLIHTVIHAQGRETVLSHILSLLKPGGWIQWEDGLPPLIIPVNLQTLEHFPHEEWPLIVQLLYEHSGIADSMKWFADLEGFIRDVGGCVDTVAIRPSVRRDTLNFESDMAMWDYTEVVKMFEEISSEDEVLSTVIEACHYALREEWRLMSKGERLWSYNFIVAIGKKVGGS